MRYGLLLLVCSIVACRLPVLEVSRSAAAVSPSDVALGLVEAFERSDIRSTYLDSLKVSKQEWADGLREWLLEPDEINPTSLTNFCSKAPLGMLIGEENPVGLARLMIDLYDDGIGKYFNGKDTITLTLSKRLKQRMQLHIKGISYSYGEDQTINPVFAVLAYAWTAHYNWGLDKKYDIGDENKAWAGTPLELEGRILRQFFGYTTLPFGSDFLTNSVSLERVKKALEVSNQHVFLLVNSRILHDLSKAGRWMVGTHYIELRKIEFIEQDEQVLVIWWEYGRIFEQTFDKRAFRRLIAGGIVFKTNRIGT
jgi:hypothetical protein